MPSPSEPRDWRLQLHDAISDLTNRLAEQLTFYRWAGRREPATHEAIMEISKLIDLAKQLEEAEVDAFSGGNPGRLREIYMTLRETPVFRYRFVTPVVRSDLLRIRDILTKYVK
ncbi:MAG: hypothetical protein ACP5HK_07590 [Acidilobus sp.]